LQKLHLFVGQQCRNFCTVFGIMSLDYFRQSTIFGRDSLASATLSAPYAGDKFSVKRVQPFCDSLLLTSDNARVDAIESGNPYAQGA
jgi:hypothetical protein